MVIVLHLSYPSFGDVYDAVPTRVCVCVFLSAEKYDGEHVKHVCISKANLCVCVRVCGRDQNHEKKKSQARTTYLFSQTPLELTVPRIINFSWFELYVFCLV